MECLRNVLMTLAVLLVTAYAVELRECNRCKCAYLSSIILIPFILASSIPKCNAGDNECIARSITAILQHHITGVPEIGLGTIDPLPFSKLDISVGGQGVISFNLTIPTGEIKGWKDIQVKKVMYVKFRCACFYMFCVDYVIICSGFSKDPKENHIELHVLVPKDTIVGKYVISGKVLLLPIAGNGDLTFIFGKFPIGNYIANSVYLYCF